MLTIRIKQLIRELVSIGIFRLIFLVAIATFIFILIFYSTVSNSKATIIGICSTLLIAYLQVSRRDLQFLKVHFERYKLTLMAEYFAITLPISLSLTIHHQITALLILAGGLLICPNLSLAKKRRNFTPFVQTLIPNHCYEWKSGVRQYFIPLLFVWILGMATPFYTASVPIAIFIIGIIIIDFFSSQEPFNIIIAQEVSAKRFLRNKLTLHVSLFAATTSPLLVVFIPFHPELWYIPCIEIIVFALIQIFVILTKYAFYIPNDKSPAAQTIGAIGCICGLSGVLLPIMLLMATYFYLKSTKNLNFYLNDFNK